MKRLSAENVIILGEEVKWATWDGGDKHMCLFGSFDIYLDSTNNTSQTTRCLDTLTRVTEDMHCRKKKSLENCIILLQCFRIWKLALWYYHMQFWENRNMIVWYENPDTIYSFFWELDSFFASMLVYFYQMKRWGVCVVFFYKKCIDKKLFLNCLYRGWYSGLKLSEDYLTPDKEILFFSHI